MLCKHEDVFVLPPPQLVSCVKSVQGKCGSGAASRCRVVAVSKGGVLQIWFIAHRI